MLAQGVKRRSQETPGSREIQDRNRGSAGEGFARRQSQKRIRAAQAIKGVRLLATDRGEFSLPQPAAHIMRAVAFIFDSIGQLRFLLWQRKVPSPGTHHSKNRGPHKKEKRDEGRNGIARQPKDRSRPGTAE